MGDFGKNDNYRGNGMSGVPDPTGGIVPNTIAGNNAESDPKNVLAALQSCNAFWMTSALPRARGMGRATASA